MGIFSAILDKLRGHNRQSAPPAAETLPGAAADAAKTAAATGNSTASAPTAAVPPSSPQAPLAAVDVGAILSRLAQQRGGGGNYQTSIVDLLKLLDLDSSLAARTELADELGVHAGAHGSAEQNIALHKAVMRKLAENGGKVPESMRS